MKYDENADHKLFWAIIVGMVVATCMILASGCSHSIIVKECQPSETPKQICKTLKPWE